jgi:hypothetical protein
MGKLIAIDVAIIPPKSVYDWAVKINNELWAEHHLGYKMDETHLPHISLFQAFVREQEIEIINETIAKQLTQHHPLQLIAKGGSTETHTDLEVSRTDEIQALHESLMRALKKYVQPKASPEAYYQDPKIGIRKKTIKWVEDFASHAYVNFGPHITIMVGVGEEIRGEKEFTADRVVNCHLGDFNSCRKILAEWRLK